MVIHAKHARFSFAKAFAALGLGLMTTTSIWSQIPTNIKFTKALGTNATDFKFDNPVWLGEMPGTPDVFFVVEQRLQSSATTGRIQVIEKNGSGAWTKSVFLTLAIRSDHDENGLLGFAFHPQYLTNHRYFLFRTINQNVQVEERKSDATFKKDSGDSAKVLITVPHSQGNHNGGCLAFGKDGFLYISIGENNDGMPAQDLTSLLGKLLRIDVDQVSAPLPYAIPSTNPFVDSTRSGIRKEIWAYGFRNPWRFSFDPLNGNLWLGDVGSDGSGRTEEINWVRRGKNYGWPCREGKQSRSVGGTCPNPTDPTEVFPNDLGWSSINGGVIYRGKTNSKFYGKYVFSIYASPDQSPIGTANLTDTVSSGIVFNATNAISQVSHMATDSKGRIYFTVRKNLGEIFLLDHPDLLPDSTITQPQLPAAPSGLGVVVGVNQITLSWSAVAGTTSYRIYYRAGTTVTKANATKNTAGISPQILASLSSDTTYAFVVSASDSVGESDVSTVITGKPLAPLIISTATLPTGRSNLSYAATLQASGGTSPYSFAVVSGSLPAGVTLSGATLSGTPTVSGTFNISIEVTDAAARKTSKAFTITLAANRAPKITSAATAKATESSDYAYNATATDADGNAMSFTFRNLPTWMTSAGAKAHGIPGTNDTSTTFWVLVSDGQLKDSLQVILQVTHSNKAPILDSTFAGVDTLAEGDSALFRVVAHDPDGDSLITLWSIDSGTPEMGSAAYRYKPNFSASGKRTLHVRVEDVNGASAEHDYNVFVKNVALPPICLHAAGDVPQSDDFAFGWKSLRDPDLDSTTLHFQMEAYQDSALKVLLFSQDSLPKLLPASVRSKLPNGSAVYMRVLAHDARSTSTGYGVSGQYIFHYPVGVRIPRSEQGRKVRALRIATQPGTSTLNREGQSTYLDAKGRHLSH
jgi:glucose/arabinose dehydrogenase